MHQRRMVMTSSRPGHVRTYIPSLVKVVLRLRGRWQKAASTSEPIMLQADLMRFTVDAIAGLAFGKEPRFDCLVSIHSGTWAEPLRSFLSRPDCQRQRGPLHTGGPINGEQPL